MTGGALRFVRNGGAAPLDSVPQLTTDDLRDLLVSSVGRGRFRIASFFGVAEPEARAVRLYAVLAEDGASRLALASALVSHGSFPSATPDCPQAQGFEREIHEQFGVRPEGHPWLKPLRFHPAWWSPEGVPQEGGQGSAPGAMDFYSVQGEEVHEVAVGPVHAGVIEPGHFRLQCHGELVMHLEISLGYQHRGIERALCPGPTVRTLPIIETVAGDTTIAHTMAYSEVVEALAGTSAPARAQALRGIALELERLANHTGDLGALAGDVAFLPTASFCGRIRGDFLNLTAELCGSRFGRGLVRPEGVRFDVEPDLEQGLRARLAQASADVTEAVELLWDTPTVLARFEGTGILSPEQCRSIGLVGPAARACSVARDVRHDFPSGIYRYVHLPVMTAPGGDVNARAFVRWLEIQQSVEFIQDRLRTLPKTPLRADIGPLAPRSIAVSLVEGWRGEVCHVGLTGEDGKLERYKIVDSSFHNWLGLALALRGGEISDFPLCNKSFNLSYCGHDL